MTGRGPGVRFLRSAEAHSQGGFLVDAGGGGDLGVFLTGHAARAFMLIADRLCGQMAGKHRDPLCALSAPVNVAQSLAPEGFTLRVKRDKGGWIYQHRRNRVHLSCSPFQCGCHANFLL